MTHKITDLYFRCGNPDCGKVVSKETRGTLKGNIGLALKAILPELETLRCAFTTGSTNGETGKKELPLDCQEVKCTGLVATGFINSGMLCTRFMPDPDELCDTCIDMVTTTNAREAQTMADISSDLPPERRPCMDNGKVLMRDD